ncbi:MULTISPECIES: hypothetical protein [unclassified Breznakia]|uniref:hypothetical protein n=1 Tax=unclassified Breznakia TaxID=2623764 RepID=UPI0024765310|nr:MULTISPECIES: hypothetical protein [unclassified Breznakia]MDH6367525.1 hypothetical protein [Breznakia sp. PH1-1]MDH6404681.1 hypothetical protein [Breznakia sp. PF1-11]MDH6412355.1 hypothetical protein [Breznakia sp. PFB1-11]MDH6414693.1 hypothetical protein [Breznakia sp. PFB1-14]MDH6417062.1 hypothetical protein [Breznakia sp. PFB1-4]
MQEGKVMKVKPGDWIIYEKSEEHWEIGLVKKEIETGNGCMVWYHCGGTVASTPYSSIFFASEHIDEVVAYFYGYNKRIFNRYAITSLMVRKYALMHANGIVDISDVITDVITDVIDF